MMTDREEFEKFWESHRLYPDWNTTVWKAWQARGELDAVKIKELEDEIIGWQEKSIEREQHLQIANSAVEELTAKLDKAKDGDCCTEGCIKCDARNELAETQEPVPIAILHRKRLEVYNPKLTVHEKADVTFLNVDETDRESNMRYQSLADGDYKLYTTPPSHEWVGLSDRELFNLSQQCNLNHILGLIDYGRAIESKLREKNG